MKKRRIILYLLSAVFLLVGIFSALKVTHAQRDSVAVISSEVRTMARVGKQAPDFTLIDQFGKKRQLKDFLGKTVVLEWLNPGCPFVKRHYKAGTTVNIEKRFAVTDKDNGQTDEIIWLRINSTAKSHRDFLTPKETQIWATKNNVTGLILNDASGEVGHLYGAKTTPNMFVIDKAGKLVFSGAMDDDPYGKKKPAKRENYVASILAAWSLGEVVEPFANDSYGCSIKYAKH